MTDLPRIGEVPECEHPRCRLDAITRVHDLSGGYRMACSLHADHVIVLGEWTRWES